MSRLSNRCPKPYSVESIVTTVSHVPHPLSPGSPQLEAETLLGTWQWYCFTMEIHPPPFRKLSICGTSRLAEKAAPCRIVTGWPCVQTHSTAAQTFRCMNLPRISLHAAVLCQVVNSFSRSKRFQICGERPCYEHKADKVLGQPR